MQILIMLIQIKKAKQACKTKRVSIALDQNALNEINYMTSKSNINRSTLIRSPVEDWCSRNRQLDSFNSEMIHQMNEPTHGYRISLVKQETFRSCVCDLNVSYIKVISGTLKTI